MSNSKKIKDEKDIKWIYANFSSYHSKFDFMDDYLKREKEFYKNSESKELEPPNKYDYYLWILKQIHSSFKYKFITNFRSFVEVLKDNIKILETNDDQVKKSYLYVLLKKINDESYDKKIQILKEELRLFIKVLDEFKFNNENEFELINKYENYLFNKLEEIKDFQNQKNFNNFKLFVENFKNEWILFNKSQNNKCIIVFCEQLLKMLNEMKHFNIEDELKTLFSELSELLHPHIFEQYKNIKEYKENSNWNLEGISQKYLDLEFCISSDSEYYYLENIFKNIKEKFEI